MLTPIAWIGSEIVYGLLLSDHTILSDVDTELVVLTGIMIQNLKNETHWHLRGMRRLGVSLNDVEGIHKCVRYPSGLCHPTIQRN